jgi:hypothetical protein
MPSCPTLVASTSLCPWHPPTWTTRRPLNCSETTRRSCTWLWCVSPGLGESVHANRGGGRASQGGFLSPDPQPPHGAVCECQRGRPLSDTGELCPPMPSGTPDTPGGKGVGSKLSLRLGCVTWMDRVQGRLSTHHTCPSCPGQVSMMWDLESPLGKSI